MTSGTASPFRSVILTRVSRAALHSSPSEWISKSVIIRPQLLLNSFSNRMLGRLRNPGIAEGLSSKQFLCISPLPMKGLRCFRARCGLQQHQASYELDTRHHSHSIHLRLASSATLLAIASLSTTLSAMAAPTRISPPKSAPSRARAGESRTAIITSRENHWLKTFRAVLRSTKPEDNRIALEGPHLVAEAIRSGLRIEAILASASGARHLPALQRELDHPTLILRTTDKLFDSLASTETPQGIAALARAPEYKLEDLLHAADS